MFSFGVIDTAVIKYQPSHGTDTQVKCGNTININTKIHCITAMKTYEAKSFEELRFEDYLAKSKPSAYFGQVFGTPASKPGINEFRNKPRKHITRNLQFRTATTPTFGAFNNITTLVTNPFGQSPFKHEAIFEETQLPTAHRRLSQQGTSTFGNTDNKTYAWGGIEKHAEPNLAFESFGINLAEPAQNQQPFGMSEPLFNFKKFTSQQNTGFVHLPKLPLEGQSLDDALRMMP